MIYHDQPKFIYIHIPKTGGTSIETALVRHLFGRSIKEMNHDGAAKMMIPQRGHTRQHASLERYVNRFGIELEDFFKFAFVRNPWELVVSELNYFRRKERRTFNRGPLSANIEKLLNFKGALWGHSFKPQISFLRNPKGEIDMDFIGRFENLREDFAKVCGALDFPEIELPHIFNFGRDREHYSTFYNDRTRALVAEYFAEDIDIFNFSFEGSTSPPHATILSPATAPMKA